MRKPRLTKTRGEACDASLHVVIPRALKRRIFRAAEQTGTPSSQWIRDALTAQLDREPPRRNEPVAIRELIGIEMPLLRPE